MHYETYVTDLNKFRNYDTRRKITKTMGTRNLRRATEIIVLFQIVSHAQCAKHCVKNVYQKTYKYLTLSNFKFNCTITSRI